MASLVRSANLPPDAASVGAARRLLTSLLRQEQADQELVDTAELLVSEVVTNAVLHARTVITLSVRIGPGLLVQVTDSSPERPRSRSHDRESTGGRGLDLIEALAADYGVLTGPAGSKTVWFTLGEAPGLSGPGWDGSPWQHPADARRVGVLLHLPVGLFRVVHQYTETLLREYDLYSMPARTPADPGARSAIWRSFADATLDAVADRPDSAFHDVDIPAGIGHGPGIREVTALFRAAEDASRAGVLLTRAAVPELLALRDWMLAEIDRQLSGGAATAWALPAPASGPAPEAAPPAGLEWIEVATEPVIAGDEHNRVLAVSPPAARLLGWTARELAGQRLTVIIPPALRELHLAGYSRHQLTGQARLIGRTVTVPALRRDGTSVDVRLRLETRNAGSVTWYLAWLSDPGE
jgi:PAS domain S-box-containing protein